MHCNVLPLHLKQTLPPMIWIFTEGEGGGIESRLPFKIFSSLNTNFEEGFLKDNLFQPIVKSFDFIVLYLNLMKHFDVHDFNRQESFVSLII